MKAHAAESKLVNDPQNAVREMLEALVRLHDHMALLDGFDQARLAAFSARPAFGNICHSYRPSS